MMQRNHWDLHLRERHNEKLAWRLHVHDEFAENEYKIDTISAHANG